MEHFSCPKCAYENPKGSVSCKRCLLIFEKYERKNKEVGTQVSSTQQLEDQWKELLLDYENKEKHEKFITDALKEKKLPFASHQYKKMIDMNAADEISKKMIDKIIQIATLAYATPFRKEPPKDNRWVVKLLIFILLFSVVAAILGGFLAKRVGN